MPPFRAGSRCADICRGRAGRRLGHLGLPPRPTCPAPAPSQARCAAATSDGRACQAAGGGQQAVCGWGRLAEERPAARPCALATVPALYLATQRPPTSNRTPTPPLAPTPQDKIEPFSTVEARAVVERELGAPIPELFSEFSAEPIAAASLAQVRGGGGGCWRGAGAVFGGCGGKKEGGREGREVAGVCGELRGGDLGGGRRGAAGGG